MSFAFVAATYCVTKFFTSPGTPCADCARAEPITNSPIVQAKAVRNMDRLPPFTMTRAIAGSNEFNRPSTTSSTQYGVVGVNRDSRNFRFCTTPGTNDPTETYANAISQQLTGKWQPTNPRKPCSFVASCCHDAPLEGHADVHCGALTGLRVPSNLTMHQSDPLAHADKAD